MLTEYFKQFLLDWFSIHGRTNLPWQHPRTPYAVWISEIMLQQTQVKTVIPYFERFMHRFPDIPTLARATEDDVLSHWSGLGYYSRGRNIRKTAQILVEHFNSELPSNLNDLMILPGIGASTAAAIASLAFNQPTAILDGNVKRVLSRFFKIEGEPQKANTIQQLIKLANACMSQERCADYTQAIMDFGATQCTPKNPNCNICPMNSRCQAYLGKCVERYPQKPIKKTIPTRIHLFPLIHTHDGRVYLEKRPEKGIWAGLWCLPWLDIDDNPELFAIKLGIATKKSKALLNLKHTFTHFHLHLHACTLEILNEGSNHQFFHPNDLKNLGIPKPIQTIIDHYILDFCPIMSDNVR